MTVLGKNIPHDAARGHVAGESLYLDDYPLAKNELLVDFVGSPVAHGRLKSVNVEAARSIPGVVGLFTVKDIDGHNCFGPIFQDEYLLVDDICHFPGHPIVVIAAENRKAIALAKKAIQVEVEPLPPVFTMDEAIAKKDFIGPTRTIERGDIVEAFDNPEHVLEGTFINGGQEHFYLESQSAIVYPGEHNSLVVHSSTQHPSEVQREVANILGLKHHQVICISKRMGGAFGGKECQATHFAAMAGLVALKTKRPARLVLNKDDDMRVTGKRHPFQNRYNVAFDDNGLFTGLIADLYCDGGCAADLSTSIMGRAMSHIDNAYYLPHVKVSGTVCKTNLPSNTAFRGFGGPQGVATIENIMEEIAIYLKKDAYEIRRLNCYGIEDRNTTPYEQVVENNMLPELFETITQQADYQKRMAAVQQFNQASKTHLKGLSLTPVKFGISFNTKFLNQANALVNVYLDGTVQVSTGGTEMGQGLNTKISQVVADAFAIPVESVMMMATSTEKNNNTSATAASSGSDLNGSAALDACVKIRSRITEYASRYFADKSDRLEPDPTKIIWENGQIHDQRLPGESLGFKDLVNLAYLDRVNMGERGYYATKGLSFSWDTPQGGKGSPFLYFTTGCAIAEVLIDRFTGDLKVERVDMLMDIGKSINPGIDRGQLTGAFIQGMGWVTTEELRYSDTGELLTHSPTTYKIPNIQDVPEIFNVGWLENERNTVNLKGSKAVGEPPLLLATCVWTAVKHALSFVSDDAIPELHLPATNEEILKRLTQYKKAATHSGTAPVAVKFKNP
jgi:xanthine dehydrogenase large subunit